MPAKPTPSKLVGVVITTPSPQRSSTVDFSRSRTSNSASSGQSTPSKALARSLSQIAISKNEPKFTSISKSGTTSTLSIIPRPDNEGEDDDGNMRLMVKFC